jgi:hypothetical protein
LWTRALLLHTLSMEHTTVASIAVCGMLLAHPSAPAHGTTAHPRI